MAAHGSNPAICRTNHRNCFTLNQNFGWIKINLRCLGKNGLAMISLDKGIFHIFDLAGDE